MKRIQCIAVTVMVLLLPVLAIAGSNNPWERKLPFKNLTVKYKISGNEKGTETLYIRDYGKEMATYHTSTVMGQKTNKVTISTTDWIYTFDLVNRTGEKNPNPHKYMLEEYNKLSKAEQKEVRKNAKDMGMSMTKGLNGKIEMNAQKILGFDCDKASIMGTTVYSIHKTGIPLKSDSNIMGISMKKEATEVSKGAVDAKYFKFPAGIVAKANPQGEAMARSVAKQTIAMLKNPEGSGQAPAANPAMKTGKAGNNMPSGMSNEKLEQAMKMLKQMQNKQ